MPTVQETIEVGITEATTLDQLKLEMAFYLAPGRSREEMRNAYRYAVLLGLASIAESLERLAQPVEKLNSGLPVYNVWPNQSEF